MGRRFQCGHSPVLVGPWGEGWGVEGGTQAHRSWSKVEAPGLSLPSPACQLVGSGGGRPLSCVLNPDSLRPQKRGHSGTLGA